MATKAELEAEVARLKTELDKALEVPPVPPPEPPSPVDRGQLYVESHPILGVTRKVTVVSQSVGDGRIGDGAVHVRE